MPKLLVFCFGVLFGMLLFPPSDNRVPSVPIPQVQAPVESRVTLGERLYCAQKPIQMKIPHWPGRQQPEADEQFRQRQQAYFERCPNGEPKARRFPFLNTALFTPGRREGAPCSARA